jgi:hypothetical protein
MLWSRIKGWIALGCVVGVLGCTHLIPPDGASRAQQTKDRLECQALSRQGAPPEGSLFRETIVTQRYIECMVEVRQWRKE